ncbi:MAG: Xaa-Pro aminopeptidase, partial [Saprospiraceae bacterium]|nr:Xaa-Pro aminopeptidase [Saprospiraceae bacterium]
MRSILFFSLLLSSVLSNAQVEPSWILPVRERAAWVDSMLEYRMDVMMPQLMEKAGIDCWI